MNVKHFVLSYYKNSNSDFHIHKVEKTVEARKPHTHEYFQIYFVSKGTLIHFLSNESSSLSRGDMFIIPPQKLHYVKPSEDAVFYSLSFMSDFLGESTKYNHLASNFLRSLQSDSEKEISPKVMIKNEDIFYIEGMMESILREFEEKPIGYEETVRAYCVILLTLLARNYFETAHQGLANSFENNKQIILHCIDYIENNFSNDLSLNEIAKRSAMSKSGFCSLFYKITGHSFNEYLNICRIKKAAVYINQGYKISAVSGLCGYNDFSTFYRNFKKIMGVSPNEYKKAAGSH